MCHSPSSGWPVACAADPTAPPGTRDSEPAVRDCDSSEPHASDVNAMAQAMMRTRLPEPPKGTINGTFMGTGARRKGAGQQREIRAAQGWAERSTLAVRNITGA